MVANSSTAGKDENSSGLRVPMATMITTRATTMLKVNRMSSSSGGSGTTSMAMITSTSAGIPRPAMSKRDRFCRRFDRVRVLMRFSSRVSARKTMDQDL